MSIRILAIGKKHEAWVDTGIRRYETRLKRPFTTEWTLLPHSSREGGAARQDESERLLRFIHGSEFVILLDEKGKLIDSPTLSKVLLVPLEASTHILFIIGGAYGVDSTVVARADFVWSLSPLVFPHQLVRLLVVEQVYRAQEIAGDRPYHHK